jgi:hypothetical protein
MALGGCRRGAPIAAEAHQAFRPHALAALRIFSAARPTCRDPLDLEDPAKISDPPVALAALYHLKDDPDLVRGLPINAAG